jgi:hypothetical protein
MIENEPSLLFVSAQIIDVQMVRGLLESEGIEAFVFDDNIVRLNPFYAQAIGGIKLFVRTKDLSAASEILRAHLNTKDDPPFSGTLAPINSSTMLGRVHEPIHNIELDAAVQKMGLSGVRRQTRIDIRRSDWILGIFVVSIFIALGYAVFN